MPQVSWDVLSSLTVMVVHYSFLYMIFAMPLTLSYRTTKVINFVHSNFITYGAYVAILLNGLYGNRNMLLAMASAFAIVGGIAVLNNIAVFEPLSRRGAKPVALMISSMGLWIFYKYLLYTIIDLATHFSRVNFVSYPKIVYEWIPSVSLDSVRLSSSFIATSLSAAAMIVGLYVLLEKTNLGRAMRAVSDNPILSEISGIPKRTVINLTWLIAGGIAGVGGVLWTSYAGAITPEAGDSMILQVFTVGFIGGLTSLTRTCIGAVLIASIENYGITLLNQFFRVETSYKPFLTFVTLITTLIVSPPLGAGGGLPYRLFRRVGKSA
ncbi:MAG: branched-chain amino acid ABC transporter permease [Desulfurococcaceae archaeon]|nr:branched-chain amino acid ABC transporter permease [Sulfolobales archaeon]MDW8170674.1 branched-chain amino acid ABC transporter permease [Desulfurococcaceae archaeon]